MVRYIVLFLSSLLFAEDIEILKINRIYDGDTFYVTLANCVKPDLVCKNIGIRVMGVDTPEMKATSPREKELALQARKITTYFLTDIKNVKLINCQPDKYFRIDCDVVNNQGQYLKDILIENKVGVPYDGGTKVTDWSKM